MNNFFYVLSDSYNFSTQSSSDYLHYQLTQNKFYRTPSVFSHVLAPCPSLKVLCNNDAGAAHAHSIFGRLNNENYLWTTEIP